MNNNLTATLKYAITSDKKMQIIAKLVQGKKVQDALEILEVLPKKWAKILYKVIKSAASNAVTNGKKKLADLSVDKILIGQWPKIKRVRFSSRSRISHYIKFRSFIKVILNSK